MKKFRLFIATSIDGYIARNDGSIDWLDDIEHPKGVDYGYGGFINEIDTIVMGRKTYDDVVGFDVDWPYSDLKCYVISKSGDVSVSTPDTLVINGITDVEINQITAGAQKDIWVVGGGVLIADFLTAGLINDMLISIIPVVLGSGRPLFKNGKETSFNMVKTESFENGVVNLIYERKA